MEQNKRDLSDLPTHDEVMGVVLTRLSAIIDGHLTFEDFVRLNDGDVPDEELLRNFEKRMQELALRFVSSDHPYKEKYSPVFTIGMVFYLTGRTVEELVVGSEK